MSPSGPLIIERRGSLFLSFAFAIIGFSAGLNALIKANQERSDINDLAPPGVIEVGIDDVFVTGAVITFACALSAFLSAVFCAFTWWPTAKHKPFIPLRIQSWTLFFCSAWLFAALVAYDFFFAHRSAQITIDLRGQHLPKPVVQRLAKLLDFSLPYRDIYSLRLLAVLPWFASVFAMVAGVMLYLAASREEASLVEINTWA